VLENGRRCSRHAGNDGPYFSGSVEGRQAAAAGKRSISDTHIFVSITKYLIAYMELEFDFNQRFQEKNGQEVSGCLPTMRL
jgi:hypothetical protein